MLIFVYVNLEVYIVEWLSRLGQKPIYVYVQDQCGKIPYSSTKKAYH